MTNKDLFRLAKISLAARKKSTRSTVRGIAFGLILLIPVLYIAFGIFGDLNKKVNQNPEILYMNLNTAAARSGAVDSSGNSEYYDYRSVTFASAHADSFKNNVSSDEVYDYEQIIAPFNVKLVDERNGAGNAINGPSSKKVFDMKIGETEKEVYVFTGGKDYYGGNNEQKVYSENTVRVPFAAIVGTDGKFAPKKITDKFGSVFISGKDGGFTGDGKGQVIVSETFVKSLGYTAEDFYGKDFSVKFQDYAEGINSNDNMTSAFIDKDNDPENNEYQNRYEQGFSYNGEKQAYFCQNYKVVGIIRDEVTSYAMKTYGAGNYDTLDHIMTNMMFFTSASQYYDDNEVLEPVMTYLTQDESDDEESGGYRDSYMVATYTQLDSEFELLNREYMAFGANCFNSYKFPSYYDNGVEVKSIPYATRNVLVDARNFDELDKAVGTVKAEFSALLGDNVSRISDQMAGMVYNQLKLVYSIFTYAVLALSVIGGIIFFASMVNLFNSIVHSVDSRKSYLGVLRAVGAKRSLINKMYMAESLTIFKRALIWILIFATAICVGIKFLLDLAFGYLNESPLMPFKMAVGFQYIPVALAVALAVLLLLGFAFSYGCSWKVSRDSITKTLSS